VYVCLGYVQKGYATGHTFTLRVLFELSGSDWNDGSSRCTKIYAIPKKKEAWAAAYLAMDWEMGIGICYMEMGFEPVATPFRRRTDCIFCLAGLLVL